MGFFDPEHKTKAHIFELLLIMGAVGLTVGRMIRADMPMTRADTIALGMGGKSTLIIGYQLLTEHNRRMRRFYSRKACLILNTLEIAFWGGVVYFSHMSTSAMCPLDKDLGVTCIMGWTIIGLAVFICVMSAYAAILSAIELRHPQEETDNRKFAQLTDAFDDNHPLRPVPSLPQPAGRDTEQYYTQYPSRNPGY
ncbi:hypothetical protein EDB81DRAFT_947569 [Dactylonectria macrodidyma]|uniref:Uncharacterized protein n=1 Tax=Dactylonectria macrodidyma TaxID=307937 RepID=A0A9P9ES84_9HYPO|nr:hypothetical protein EDB81DRAFT_947569 [Dactylonectria macrodidyma]